jgi:metal-dependent amidase/aminoacylase/carboxypeptidase family protein
VEAIKDANLKVNRALKAGADAIGAEVDINDLPGYMPYHHDPVLDGYIEANCFQLVGEEEVVPGEHSTGSTDMGDISCIMPTSSFRMGGVSGEGHSRTYKVVDEELQYVVPAKILAMTCIDLLYDGAAEAKNIIGTFEPKISRENYTEFMHNLVK